jgi:hypothetical protein
MKKWDYYLSFAIYAIIYYLMLLIAIYIAFSAIQLLFPIPLNNLFIGFLALVLFNHGYAHGLEKQGRKKAIKDLASPINDSESTRNKILDLINNRPQPFLKIINFFRRNLQIALIYGVFLTACNVRREWNSACDNPEFLSFKEHDGIVVIVYNKLSSSAMFGCGIDLLINHFKNENKPYKIYLCHDRREFLKIFNAFLC